MEGEEIDRHSAHIIWSKITTEVKNKVIIESCTGEVLPGQFLAIMGPSGAGKTSLLNVIADKFSGSGVKQTEGQVFLNGRSIKDLPYKFITAFVPQVEILSDYLTVKETLMFSANLALRLNKSEKEARVNQILEDLQLTTCQDTILGGVLKRGVSGGQKKRTSIGYELITDPSVLFLDEPTTGLDSYTALLLVQLLRNLAKNQNRTIIATLHQPTSEIYEELDQLSLMTQGKTVYQGSAKTALEYFEKLGYPCRSDFNPADHLMNILCDDSQDYSESLMVRIQSLCEKNAKNIEPKVVDLSELKPYPQAFILDKFRALVWRGMINYIRAPILFRSKLAKAAFMGLVLCSSFWQIGSDQKSIQDRQGAMFMLITLLYFDIIYACLDTFHSDKALFIREYSGRRYNSMTFFSAMFTVYVPLELFFTFGLVTVCYYLIGLNDHTENFLKCQGAFALLSILSILNGNLISLVTPDVQTSVTSLQAVSLPFLVVSGVVINNDNIPDWFFFKWISPIRFCYEAIFLNEYDNLSEMSKNLRDNAVDQMNFHETYNENMEYMCISIGVFLASCAATIYLVNRRY